MREPLLDWDSQTSKRSELRPRFFGATASTPSDQRWLMYIGSRLSDESATSEQRMVMYTGEGKTWRIAMIIAARHYALLTKEAVTAEPVVCVTDRELTDGEIREQISNLHAEIISCFAGLTTGELEDGMTDDLGTNIAALVMRHKDLAIRLMGAIIFSNQVPADVLSHSLRWIGRIKDEETFHERLWLLRSSLKSSSAVIRDGAGLGLAALGSPRAIPSLRQAIKRENLPSLRADLEQVLRRLESKK